MINKQLLNYIQKTIEGGYSTEEISAALTDQGWDHQEIKEALAVVQQDHKSKRPLPVAPAAPGKSQHHFQLKTLSASQVLLYLGGLIVVLAGLIYIGINWSYWSAAPRIVAILLPMLITYCVGTEAWLSKKYKTQGLVFMVVGALLFPLFLWITFQELKLFPANSLDSFYLTISLLTSIAYLISNYFFRSPVWTLLYQAAGVAIYYSLLKVLGVENIFAGTSLAWLLLLPGTAYLLLTLWYEKSGQKDRGFYSHLLGSLVIIATFCRLYIDTFSQGKASTTWLLLLLGLAYFILGLFYEKNNFQKYSQDLYRLGSCIFFLSMLRLCLDGTFLREILGNPNGGSNQDLIGWSNVIPGVLYLVFADLLERSKKFHLEEASKYQDLFNLLGCFWTLSAIFYLGWNDKKPLYETLLLLSSLGFIFASIPKQARQFLAVGTLFLIIYIFSIGGKYFQNQAGWPITLFVAGLASMGVGFGIEKIRRKYFN